VSHRRLILALLLLIPAGCSTGPRQSPPDFSALPEPEMVPFVPQPVEPPTPVPTPIPTPAPAPATPPANDRYKTTETWIPLDRWCQANSLPAPRRSVADASVVYSFAGSNGTMSITIDSHRATWRGTDYYLGFTPRLINGHPCVHALDIRKNFLPLLENSQHLNTRHVIVIDPGHGGTDPGTKSVFNGHFEKEYTLDLARRLQTLLAANGWTVFLTRTSDTYVPLPDRVAVAEQRHAGLFISLHFNTAAPDETESGVETYCLTPKGMSSTLTRNYPDDTTQALPNNKYDAENLQYAATLQRAVLKINGHADRGVRRARFLGVLKGQNRPALLMEGGFLSNRKEARRIADPAYRQTMAEALAQALLEDSGMTVNFAGESPAPTTVSRGEQPGPRGTQ